MRPFHYLILLLLPPLIGVLRTELPRWILEEISSPRGFIRTGTDPDAFVFRISRVSYIGNILPCQDPCRFDFISYSSMFSREFHSFLFSAPNPGQILAGVVDFLPDLGLIFGSIYPVFFIEPPCSCRHQLSSYSFPAIRISRIFGCPAVSALLSSANALTSVFEVNTLMEYFQLSRGSSWTRIQVYWLGYPFQSMPGDPIDLFNPFIQAFHDFSWVFLMFLNR